MSKYTAVINDAVPMTDIVTHYLPGEKIVRGRIRCPFHGGHDRNLSIQDKCWKCWVCGEKGNNIRFVELLFSESRDDAERRINNDFGLRLPVGGAELSLAEQVAARQRLRDIRAENVRKEMHEAAASAHRCLFMDAYLLLNRLRLEALEEVAATGKYPDWAAECFRQFMDIEQYIQEGGDENYVTR